MRKSSVVKIIALISVAGFVSAYLVFPRFAAQATIDSAIGELARAESAQTPNEVIDHVIKAKRLLPPTGPVIWWAPEKADFKTIQAELDDILGRARDISMLELGDELYNSEMYDIHARLKIIQETLVAF